MWLIGLYLAGLFLVAREFVPWVGALSSGVIRTRSHKREKVTRAADPERFRVLTRQRFVAMGPGALCLAAAIGWTLWSVFNMVVSNMAGGGA